MIDIRYSIPEGVRETNLNGKEALTTLQDGVVVIDRMLLEIWRMADKKTLSDLHTKFVTSSFPSETLMSALACLSEAGLLIRDQQEEAPQPSRKVAGRLVSVVIVTADSLEWLDTCLHSIYSQTYQPVEIIVVDNASKDETKTWLEDHFSRIRIIELAKRIPFSAALNKGISAAKGEYILVLNPDTSLEARAIERMVSVIESDPGCAAVAPKIKLMPAPGFLNGIGNHVGPHSWGTDNGLGSLDLGQFDQWSEIPSACFAASLLRRPLLEDIGKVDEGFPMYYEDSEWSYRARVLGYRILAAPEAVIWHAFGCAGHPAGKTKITPRKLEYVVYGRLRFAAGLLVEYKNRFLDNYLFEDSINLLRYFFTGNFTHVESILKGWRTFIRDRQSIAQQNRSLNQNRSMTDPVLFSLQNRLPANLLWKGYPVLSMDLVENHYQPDLVEGNTRLMPEFSETETQKHLLIISHDVVGSKMAGPGIRYLEIARELSNHMKVTLAVPDKCDLEEQSFSIFPYRTSDQKTLKSLTEDSDAVLFSGYLLEKFPFLRDTPTRKIVDLYDPMVLENLYYHHKEPLQYQQVLNHRSVKLLNDLAQIGDFFICANSRQRDFWLGLLTANGRVNPQNYHADKKLEKLIAIVSNGIPDRPPQTTPFLRGLHPNIPEEAKIVLWGGGVWNWLDPHTLLQAWPQVVKRFPKARLVFPGLKHPNPDVPAHSTALEIQAMVQELGDLDDSVVLLDWVDINQRESLLSEADIGIATHKIHIETRYSLRTRVLDYIWARLPILVTKGDLTSEWVSGYGIGKVVPESDEKAVGDALIHILENPSLDWYSGAAPLIENLKWSATTQPLREYIHCGDFPPDRSEPAASSTLSGISIPMDIARARMIWKIEGPGMFFHRLWRTMLNRFSRL
jgi:GT2 family glycosyltransferase/glycosyltransferase involved in cell wall biosynthesis